MANIQIIAEFARMWPRVLFEGSRRSAWAAEVRRHLDFPGVYVLCRDEHPYYVGQTKGRLYRRIWSHGNRPQTPHSLRAGPGRTAHPLLDRLAAAVAPMSLPAAALSGLLALAATGQGGVTVVEDWAGYPRGGRGVPGRWSTYGPAASRQSIIVVTDSGRPALRLTTERSSIRLGLRVDIDVGRTPWLQWDWKPLTLPRHGNVLSPINDQVARVFVVFGSAFRPRAIGYLWDTAAPVGTVIAQTRLLLDRRLIVVRSGGEGLGRWHTERRNVSDDHARLFGTRPDTVRAIGIESHSEDAAHESQVLFGRLLFTGG